MNKLISALIEHQAIGSDNVVTASYTVRDGVGRFVKKVGTFGIVSFEKYGDTINFTLQDVIEKNKIQVDDESILAIDGMDIGRYADVYNLNSDGTSKKLGKKRGRKPKSHSDT